MATKCRKIFCSSSIILEVIAILHSTLFLDHPVHIALPDTSRPFNTQIAIDWSYSRGVQCVGKTPTAARKEQFY